VDVDRKRNILFGWIVTGFHGINAHVSGSFNQCRRVDRPTPSEALLGSHIRINLVGLEVTEPRMVPSNGWKSCLRPLPQVEAHTPEVAGFPRPTAGAGWPGSPARSRCAGRGDGRLQPALPITRTEAI